jgi:hypothetical protein
MAEECPLEFLECASCEQVNSLSAECQSLRMVQQDFLTLCYQGSNRAEEEKTCRELFSLNRELIVLLSLDTPQVEDSRASVDVSVVGLLDGCGIELRGYTGLLSPDSKAIANHT